MLSLMHERRTFTWKVPMYRLAADKAVGHGAVYKVSDILVVRRALEPDPKVPAFGGTENLRKGLPQGHRRATAERLAVSLRFETISEQKRDETKPTSPTNGPRQSNFWSKRLCDPTHILHLVSIALLWPRSAARRGREGVHSRHGRQPHHRKLPLESLRANRILWPRATKRQKSSSKDSNASSQRKPTAGTTTSTPRPSFGSLLCASVNAILSSRLSS